MGFFTKESVESVNDKPDLKTTPTVKKDMKEKNYKINMVMTC